MWEELEIPCCPFSNEKCPKCKPSSLDERLREILEDWYPGTMYEDVIPKIKQLYADEVTPKVDAIMQDMVNLQANMKHDMLRLGMTPTPEKANDE